jgi:hypothetical protein
MSAAKKPGQRELGRCGVLSNHEFVALLKIERRLS